MKPEKPLHVRRYNRKLGYEVVGESIHYVFGPR
jgi:hypothetical protein